MKNTKDNAEHFSVPISLRLKHLLRDILFPSLKSKGEKEYYTKIILRSFTFLSVTYSIALIIGAVLYIHQDIFTVNSLIWTPELVFIFPFLLPLFNQETVGLFGDYTIIVIIPFFIGGVVAGILWREESKDVVPSSSVLSFLFVALLFLTQNMLYLSVSSGDNTVTRFKFLYVELFIFSITFFELIFGTIASFIGSILGMYSAKAFFSKKGSRVVYDPQILPEIPIATKTIFDLKIPERQIRMSKTISLVYLSQRVERIFYRTHTTTCPYFEDGRCAYLGYKTIGHRLQICKTEYWPLCRVYAFLTKSKQLILSHVRGVSNNED
ncbi:MAG: hypothetical protein ACTSYD_05710 [Candidatus Heimdallarchaeaceae archaeon]